MTQEAMLRRDAFVRDARPTDFAPALGSDQAFRPQLRRFEIDLRVYGVMVVALGNCFAAVMRRGLNTDSGHMSGSAVLWQVVTLPLLAGFGLFVLAYRAFV